MKRKAAPRKAQSSKAQSPKALSPKAAAKVIGIRARTTKRPLTTAVAAIELPSQFDIRTVREVARTLRDCIERRGSLRVDAQAVTSTDAAGLQLLIVARRAAQTRGLAFEWIAISSSLLATSETLGLRDLLGLTHGVSP